MTEIRQSADAVDGLFRFALRQWSGAVGAAALAKRLGVVPSKVSRAVAGATISFELAARFQRLTGLPWIEIFTFPSRGTRSSVVYPERLRDAAPAADVAALEEQVQTTLRRAMFHMGWARAASALGVPRSTLHDCLQRSRLPLSIVWSGRLLTGTPVSELIAGKEEPDERELRKRIGSEDDYTGRMDDADEPVVRLAELRTYNEIVCPVGPLERLFRGRRSAAQAARLSVILAANYKYRGFDGRAAAALRKGWERLRSRKTYFGALIFHAAMSAHVGQHALSREVCERILKLKPSPSVVAQVYRILADSALDRLHVDEAASMARRGLAIEKGVNLSRDQLEQTLAACAWLYGDAAEAQWRSRRLLRSPTTAPILKQNAAEMVACTTVYAGDLAGARAALRQLPDRSRVAMYLWRIDPRRPAEPPSEHAEMACLRAVCRYLAKGDKTGLKRTWARLLKQGWSDGRHPVANLPDFLRALREAGLWTKECRTWLDDISRFGFRGVP